MRSTPNSSRGEVSDPNNNTQSCITTSNSYWESMIINETSVFQGLGPTPPVPVHTLPIVHSGLYISDTRKAGGLDGQEMLQVNHTGEPDCYQIYPTMTSPLPHLAS